MIPVNCGMQKNPPKITGVHRVLQVFSAVSCLGINQTRPKYSSFICFALDKHNAFWNEGLRVKHVVVCRGSYSVVTTADICHLKLFAMVSIWKTKSAHKETNCLRKHARSLSDGSKLKQRTQVALPKARFLGAQNRRHLIRRCAPRSAKCLRY